MARPASTAESTRKLKLFGIAILGVLAAALAGLAALAIGAWHYSDLVLLPPKPSTLHEQRVLAAGPNWVRLSRDRESLEPGTWALQWETGYGWVDRVLATTDSDVVREYRPTLGELPVGGWASLRGVSKAADPRTLLGLEFSNVTYDGPLGQYPAWLIPGADTTWVIAVHGRAAMRAEALRTVSAIEHRGLPIMVIAYRNDASAPPAPDGYSHLGETEWTDLEAAARYALSHGARRLVLFGYSMGGQMVVQFLLHSTLAPRVAAAVLESPMLDWNAGLALRAHEMGAPAFITPIAQWVATRRGGLDWHRLDLTTSAAAFSTPVLLFHGTKDTYAPVARSEAFAQAHASNVTLVRYTSANHVEAWNVDPASYTATLNYWLTTHGVGGGGPLPNSAPKGGLP
ncbi:MAG: alpha/beta hydrolase family protein [Candidatus Eiseniibacteriota bacterium]